MFTIYGQILPIGVYGDKIWVTTSKKSILCNKLLLFNAPHLLRNELFICGATDVRWDSLVYELLAWKWQYRVWRNVSDKWRGFNSRVSGIALEKTPQDLF